MVTILANWQQFAHCQGVQSDPCSPRGVQSMFSPQWANQLPVPSSSLGNMGPYLAHLPLGGAWRRLRASLLTREVLKFCQVNNWTFTFPPPNGWDLEWGVWTSGSGHWAVLVHVEGGLWSSGTFMVNWHCLALARRPSLLECLGQPSAWPVVDYPLPQQGVMVNWHHQKKRGGA